jgi:UDP-N-acetylmuramoylalanine--D-glutamate ligase
MIAVQGMHGRRVFVLGMGRSGLVAAQALVAGGADVLCWDDGETGTAAGRGGWPELSRSAAWRA